MTTVVPNPRSSIMRLPRALREAVDKAVAEGATLDQITALIREQGGACSRSAVARYAKRMRDGMRQEREADGAIQAWARELGSHPESRAAESAIEIMRALVASALFNLSGDEGPATARELARLAFAVWRIERTNRPRLKQELMAAKAAASAAEALRRAGFSPEAALIVCKGIENMPATPPPQRRRGNPATSDCQLIPDNPA